AYDPSEFENLEATPEIKNLFSYITCYTPQLIDLDMKLRPFIPDYIPAVGDIDAFIKIPRPDGIDDNLGLTVLDEPSSKNQSDSTLLNLKLRAISRKVPVSNEHNTIKIASSPKDIDNWIQNIQSLHEATLSASSGMALINSQRLPDIEALMQEWDEEFENALSQYELPESTLDCSLEDYVSIICGLLDIPLYSSKVASLHVLFNLYNEFKNSQT
ncbi:Intraflagellar transport protein 46-like protein, partial [Dinothrombium tinctorium]